MWKYVILLVFTNTFTASCETSNLSFVSDSNLLMTNDTAVAHDNKKNGLKKKIGLNTNKDSGMYYKLI